ncbi:hypothetical protein LOC54_08485 [Acetobacter sp. AN02]|uniref:hypothetical protein n=1 Tax=Acetobacter sp. AN02 TaxID=2894186 RepID=UPI00243454E8|nr:hypothetical protein [Acetobacter sp. AN02]MDG6095141.1 hypothetical protein [Acetobacter sp. AN02]
MLKYVMAAVCVVSAALVNAAGPACAADLSGVWYGVMVTEQGQCPDAEDSVLKVSPGELTFSPGGGSIVLHGKRKKDVQTLHAQLRMQDAKGHPMPMVFEGQPEGDRITGVYGTPFCRAHIEMKRD